MEEVVAKVEGVADKVAGEVDSALDKAEDLIAHVEREWESRLKMIKNAAMGWADKVPQALEVHRPVRY